MTLPIKVSLGSHCVLYLAVLVDASNPDEHFFSINISSYFHPSSDTLCPEVCVMEASDSSWKLEVWSWQLSTRGVDNMIYPVCFTHVAATARISSRSLESLNSIQISQLSKRKQPGIQKTLSFRHCLFKSYHHYITQSTGLGGLWRLITMKVLMFSHCVKLCLCWQIKSKSQLIQPIPPPVFRFLLPFNPTPHFLGMMTVSHNAGQREPDCSWAECWKACAFTHAPQLWALQQWKDWEGEWWAFNTMHNRAPQPQTGTIFTLS